MTDAWNYDDDQTNQTNLNNGPKPLRDAYEAQKRRADEMASEIAAIKAELAKSKVADIVESQGLARGAAQFYTGDPDPDKVSAWVTDMRTTFGGASAPAATPAAPTIDPTDAAKLQSMMQAGAGAATQGNYEVAYTAMSDPGASTADRIAAFQAFARQQQS